MKKLILGAVLGVFGIRLALAMPSNPPPQWSSDGGVMMVISYGDIHIFDAAGNETKRMTIESPTDVYLSPDGGKIAYVLHAREIWILDIVSNSRVQVFSPQDTDSCGEVRWLPVGSTLMYSMTSRAGGTAQGQLYMVQADGSGKKLLLTYKP